MSGVHFIAHADLAHQERFAPCLTKKDVRTFAIVRACLFDETALSKGCDHECIITLNDRRCVKQRFKDDEIRLFLADFSSGSSSLIAIKSALENSHFSSDFTEALLTDVFKQSSLSGLSEPVCITKKAIREVIIASYCFKRAHSSRKACAHDCTISLIDQRSAQIRLRDDQIRLLCESLLDSQIVCQLDQSHFATPFTEAVLTELFSAIPPPLEKEGESFPIDYQEMSVRSPEWKREKTPLMQYFPFRRRLKVLEAPLHCREQRGADHRFSPLPYLRLKGALSQDCPSS